jgi:hemolysin activation/secretion protein
MNNALHLPAFSPLKLAGQADAFVFLDAASLYNRDPLGGFTHLASVGLGLNYQYGRHFSLTASYGRQLTDIPATGGKRSSLGHIGATFSF